MKKPKAILFDFGDTLLENVDFIPEKGNKALFECISRNPNNISVDQIIARAKEMDIEVDRKRNESQIEYSWISFTKVLYESLGISLSISYEEAEMVFEKASEVFKPEKDIRSLLETIKAQEILMAIVSNCTYSMQVFEYELSKWDIRKYFKCVVISSEYGIRKPNHLLFNTAGGKMGVKSNDIWFVGDSIECDMAGAIQVGMTSIWYNPKGKKPNGIKPIMEIWNHSELEKRIRSC